MLITLNEVLSFKNSAVQTSQPEDKVYDAVFKMHQHNIGALLVTSEGRVVGVFTERDVMFRMVHTELDPKSTSDSEVMTPDPISVAPSTTVEQAMQLVTEKRIRHLPVVDDGRLVGMVSSSDLTRVLTSNQEAQIDGLIRSVKVMAHGV